MDEPSRRPTTAFASMRVAAARLEAAGIASPRLDAEVLLRHVLGLDRTSFFLRRGDPLSADDLQTYQALVQRRIGHESVAYIIGHREFMGIPFAVGPGVLVPRPETEVLVEWALDWLRSAPSGTSILDIGTGSGAIALSVAAIAAGSVGPVIASDASANALVYAARNRETMDLDRRVSLVRGDLATWHGGGVGLLLANLPYLRPDQVVGNANLASEPDTALIGGDDGLDAIRRLIRDAPRLVTDGGAIGLEIDPSQADTVLAMGAAMLRGFDWRVVEDLAGLARHVVGESTRRSPPRRHRS